MTIVPTQAAREAAAECIENGLSHLHPAEVRAGFCDGWHLVQAFAEREADTRQAFLTEILDHLTTEHSGGLGSHPGARVVAEAIQRKFGEGQQPS